MPAAPLLCIAPHCQSLCMCVLSNESDLRSEGLFRSQRLSSNDISGSPQIEAHRNQQHLQIQSDASVQKGFNNPFSQCAFSPQRGAEGGGRQEDRSGTEKLHKGRKEHKVDWRRRVKE